MKFFGKVNRLKNASTFSKRSCKNQFDEILVWVSLKFVRDLAFIFDNEKFIFSKPQFSFVAFFSKKKSREKVRGCPFFYSHKRGNQGTNWFRKSIGEQDVSPIVFLDIVDDFSAK